MKRITKLIRRFLMTLGALVLLVMLAGLIGALSRDDIDAGSILTIRFDGPLREAPGGGLEALLGDAVPSLHEVTGSIRRAAVDDDIAGVVLNIGAPQLSLADVLEVEEAMAVLRESGKWNVAYLDTVGELLPDNVAYALAVTASEVVMAPCGDVNVAPLQAEVPFIKGTLEKLRITPYAEKRKEYKNAANMFTEKQFTPAHEQSMAALLGGLQETFIEHVASRRGRSLDEVRGALLDGAIAAEQAKELGLVDRVEYWDVVRAAAEEHGQPEDPLVPLGRYLATFSPPRGAVPMAIIFGAGEVVREDPGGLLDDERLVASRVTQAFRDAREAKVSGVLFRVNSPGGSYVGSDLVRREVQLTREAGIPVVVSMGGMAASGGYFVSMDANAIFALPATLTGSIGVFALLFATRDMWNALGVTFEQVAGLEGADVLGFLDPPGEVGKERLRDSVDRIYADFVGKVARARHLEPDAAEAAAQGRVWTGKQAKELGLVDELGGLRAALDHLKGLANVPAEQDVVLRMFPEPETPLGELQDLLSGGRRAGVQVSTLLHTVRAAVSNRVLLRAPIAEAR